MIFTHPVNNEFSISRISVFSSGLLQQIIEKHIEGCVNSLLQPQLLPAAHLNDFSARFSLIYFATLVLFLGVGPRCRRFDTGWCRQRLRSRTAALEPASSRRCMVRAAPSYPPPRAVGCSWPQGRCRRSIRRSAWQPARGLAARAWALVQTQCEVVAIACALGEVQRNGAPARGPRLTGGPRRPGRRLGASAVALRAPCNAPGSDKTLAACRGSLGGWGPQSPGRSARDEQGATQRAPGCVILLFGQRTHRIEQARHLAFVFLDKGGGGGG